MAPLAYQAGFGSGVQRARFEAGKQMTAILAEAKARIVDEIDWPALLTDADLIDMATANGLTILDAERYRQMRENGELALDLLEHCDVEVPAAAIAALRLAFGLAASE